MRLSCPSQYQYYECEVISLILGMKETTFVTPSYNYNTSAIAELRCDYGLDFVNGLDTKTHSQYTIAMTSTNVGNVIQAPFKFKVKNFNNKTVKFSLLGDDGNLLTYNNYLVSTSVIGTFDYNKPWTLVIKMRGTNE
jgi:hypothetical protein